MELGACMAKGRTARDFSDSSALALLAWPMIKQAKITMERVRIFTGELIL
jgi:hypothetical protein